ncbi:kxDL motif-containing protein 1-like [Saccoglossus kowalevskii]|uniref:KxDL motif-containing protein 1-like n=1 Tax=Saccoglossus kowalevskii TaxID=10224 RepID=A0ABM0MZY6_SACKO|nr:PREDICTED: kxDL motif-containing protein 1-like [Saccoglossus kowalevskii]
MDAPKTPLKTDTPASDAFISLLSSLVNREDVDEIILTQRQMLNRFEKTNEMLSSFNKLSTSRYDESMRQFKEHTRTLVDMKKDLETVFTRIRSLKIQVAKQHPNAYAASQAEIMSLMTPEEEEVAKMIGDKLGEQDGNHDVKLTPGAETTSPQQ